MRGLHPDPVFAFKGLLKRMTEPLVPLLCISPDLSIDRNLMVLDRFTKTYDELREHLRRDSGSLPIWEVFHYMFWKAAEASLDELKTS